MSSLGDVLGSILAAVAHARRIADEETAALAEYYRSQPLLEGMSLPRVRIPEMVIDLPVLIDEEEPSRPASLSDMTSIRDAVSRKFMDAAEAEGVDLPKATRQRLEQQLTASLKDAGVEGEKGGGGERRKRPGGVHVSEEQVVRAVEQAIRVTLENEPVRRLDQLQARDVTRAVLREAATVAVRRPRSAPGLAVQVVTSEVKEKATDATVTRLKLVLREEGMEWTSVEDERGRVRRFLTPE